MSQVQAVIMTSQLWNSTNEDVLIKNSIISHSIYLVQCLLGVLLNTGILVVFFFMKKVEYFLNFILLLKVTLFGQNIFFQFLIIFN